jgi:hypothetical protein
MRLNIIISWFALKYEAIRVVGGAEKWNGNLPRVRSIFA